MYLARTESRWPVREQRSPRGSHKSLMCSLIQKFIQSEAWPGFNLAPLSARVCRTLVHVLHVLLANTGAIRPTLSTPLWLCFRLVGRIKPPAVSHRGSSPTKVQMTEENAKPRRSAACDDPFIPPEKQPVLISAQTPSTARLEISQISRHLTN